MMDLRETQDPMSRDLPEDQLLTWPPDHGPVPRDG
jgi:hypothetical protein